jgi:hypothetical protein
LPSTGAHESRSIDNIKPVVWRGEINGDAYELTGTAEVSNTFLLQLPFPDKKQEVWVKLKERHPEMQLKKREKHDTEALNKRDKVSLPYSFAKEPFPDSTLQEHPSPLHSRRWSGLELCQLRPH